MYIHFTGGQNKRALRNGVEDCQYRFVRIFENPET